MSTSLRLSHDDPMKRTFINQQRTFTQHNRCLRDPHSHMSEGGGVGTRGEAVEGGKEISSRSLSNSDLGHRTLCSGQSVTLRGERSSMGTFFLSELTPNLREHSTPRQLSNLGSVHTKLSSPSQQTVSTEWGHVGLCSQKKVPLPPTWCTSSACRPE